MISDGHIRYEFPPEEEAERYQRLYRRMIRFWLPVAFALGVLVGHYFL